MNYSSQGVKLQVNAQAEPLQNQVVEGGLHGCSSDENELSGTQYIIKTKHITDFQYHRLTRIVSYLHILLNYITIFILCILVLSVYSALSTLSIMSLYN